MDNSAHDLIIEGVGEMLAEAGSTRVPAVTATVEDILTEEDLAAYIEAEGSLPAEKSIEKDVASLRAKHHQVARLLALNLPESLIATMTGYTAPWISTLKNSPSMVELISHYRLPGDNATMLIAEKLRFLADLSIEQLVAKINSGEVDVNQLLAAAKLGADRSNNGPMSKVAHDHRHHIDEEQVHRLAETARKRSAERIIDVSAVRGALPSPKSEGDDAG